MSVVAPFVLRVEDSSLGGGWVGGETGNMKCRDRHGAGKGGYTPLIDLGIEVSNAVVEAEDVSQFSREGAGDCAR